MYLRNLVINVYLETLNAAMKYKYAVWNLIKYNYNITMTS